MMEKVKEDSKSRPEVEEVDLSNNEKNGALYDEFVVSGERFSSDEEVEDNTTSPHGGESKKSKKKKKKSTPNKAPATNVLTEENSMIVDGLHIKDLSDSELYNKLNEYGVDVGPIVDSTRNIYRKKLAILMRGGSNFNNSASPTKIENGNSEPINNGKEEFSADEEALELSEEINDEEPAETISESIIRRISRRSTAESVKKVSRTATPRTLNSSSNLSDIRTRISSSSNLKPDRFTPTPRRSIHSYRGNEDEDSVRYRYRVSQNHSALSQEDNLSEETQMKSKKDSMKLSTCSKFIRILPYFFLFLVFITTVLYVYQNYAQKKEFSKFLDDTINWAKKTSDFIIEKMSSPSIPTPPVKSDSSGRQ